MASTSKKSVSFAKEKEEIAVESSESDSSDESDVPDYVESFSEGELWSSSDEEHTELFEHVLEGAYLSPLSSKSRLDPAQRVSLLLLDKDILQREEEGEILHPMLALAVYVLLALTTHLLIHALVIHIHRV